jgi:hypothetical protein
MRLDTSLMVRFSPAETGVTIDVGVVASRGLLTIDLLQWNAIFIGLVSLK